jgi:hypothetical protein
MPWQQYMLDVALEVDHNNQVMWRGPDGKPKLFPVLVHRKVGLSICRQQGKTVSVLALSIHRLRTWWRQNVTYAAQTRIKAREKWEDDFVETVMTSSYAPEFRKRSTNGQEALICNKTHSMMGVTANTEKAGHGDVLDLGLRDEFFSHEDDRLEQAFGPAMLTRPLAQDWWLSAAGTDRSIPLNRSRMVGRQLIQDYWQDGVIQNVAYFEWYPDDEARRDLFDTWLTVMPALCPEPPCHCDPEGLWFHTVTEPVVRSELISMDPDEFDRAYLNRTRKKTLPLDVNIPTKEWPKRANKASRKGPKLSFSVDITPQRDHGSIAVFSVRDDGIGHMELVAFRPGVDWLPGALKLLAEKWQPISIGIDAVTGSPTVTLLDKLLAIGFTRPEGQEKPKRGQLWIPSLNEYVSACGQIVDDIRRGRVEHPDQVALNVAVGGARTRPLGDAWALARKSAIVNISPFVAVTLARGAYFARVDKLAPDESDPGIWFLGSDPEEAKKGKGVASVWRRPNAHLGRQA